MANFVSYENSQALMQAIADKFKTVNGAYVFRGSLTFANLPATITKSMVGYVYNMLDDFTTDARFLEGAGKKYSAGTNVSITDQSTYDAVTPVGTEDPSTEGWYELVGGEYILSEDTTVDSGKTYYEYNESFKFDTVSTFVNVDAILGMISGTFSDAVDYEKGDVVIYEDALYKFKADHTAGAWDATEVDAKTVAELIAEAEPESLTTAQVNTLIALLD